MMPNRFVSKAVEYVYFSCINAKICFQSKLLSFYFTVCAYCQWA